MSEPAKKIATNRKAFHDFFVLDRLEAGIQLRGTEVKSIRQGLVTLTGGYVMLDQGQALLHDVHIQPYDHGNRFNHEPARVRRLLLHAKEILKLEQQTAQKGCTVVPLSMYFKHGLAKVEIGLCRGKASHDKRDELRKDTADRETRRAIAARANG